MVTLLIFQEAAKVMRSVCDGVTDIAKVKEAAHTPEKLEFMLLPNPPKEEPLEKHIKVLKHKDLVAGAEEEKLKNESEKSKQSGEE